MKIFKRVTSKLLILLTLIGFSLVGETNSGYLDQIKSVGNSISATNWNPATVQTEPEAMLILSEDKKSISFSVKNISDFVKLNYELTYETNTVPQGIVGEHVLQGEPEFKKEKILLGTCSSSGCTYHDIVKNLKLKISLLDEKGERILIERYND